MVRGLFPKVEQPSVLQALEGSVVLITPDSIEDLILEETWSSTAWSLANIYLHWLGLELLGPEATAALGQNEHLRCFITPAYFGPQEPLADFLVHEAAHVFHNCKRETLGLKFTRNREWLLPVAFQHRERFALACEAYSRMCELGKAALDGVDEDSAFSKSRSCCRWPALSATAGRRFFANVLRFHGIANRASEKPVTGFSFRARPGSDREKSIPTLCPPTAAISFSIAPAKPTAPTAPAQTTRGFL